MSHKYAQIVFTDAVRQVQTELNSRNGYSRMDEGDDCNHLLSEFEAEFIAQRDSFYMASVSETSWPYVQHRGGAAGFVHVLDASTIGFSDFSGNRQYVSVGNFRGNDRVALFFMDYPNKRRLKIMGRIQQVSDEDWAMQAALEVEEYRATVERAFIIKIEAFDWNCPQHITPRFTESDIEKMIGPLREENEALKALHQTALTDRYPKMLGQGELALVISGIRQLSPSVRAYELRHCDEGRLSEVAAGSYLQIPVQLNTGEVSFNHYPICSNPTREDIYEIAVLKNARERGISQVIYDHFQLGMVLNCTLPTNHFSLHKDNRPAILIAEGMGIALIKPMAQVLKAHGIEFEIHYTGKRLSEMAFQDRLSREFGVRLHCYVSENGERMPLNEVILQAAKNAVFYACGPQGLLEQVLLETQRGAIPSERVRIERF